MEKLPIFTDVYDANKYSLTNVKDDEFTLMKMVKPFPYIKYTIPAGTMVNISSKDTLGKMEDDQGSIVGQYAHFIFPVNYFHVLHHEINCLMAETTEYHENIENGDRMCRINAGYKYLEALLQTIGNINEINEEMVHPTEMSIDLLNKFKDISNPPIELISNCLNICTALLPLAHEEIFIRVINLSIFPTILNHTNLLDYKKYAYGVQYESGLIGSYLVDIEKKRGRFDVLRSYLIFLREYTSLHQCRYMQIEIPGLIFILRDVFPYLYTWRFENHIDKYKIYAEILGFICDVLDEVVSCQTLPIQYENDNTNLNSQRLLREKQLLRDIVVYSLLNMENGLILLRFVGIGNKNLHASMAMENNWMVPQTHSLLLLVRLSMRILMQILKLKKTIYHDRNELTALEEMIYTLPKQRDTLRIIPVVTGYMCNIFDRTLPILSCRLLKRIALEFNMSLLACLDMEADQIRMTFLQKLPDELESDLLKYAILELVEACIEKQPGMTEAFFKISYGKERETLGKEINIELTESILTYMQDYLTAVDRDPKILEQLLPSKVMNLFHSLWKHNMQSLVHSLSKNKEFWMTLCKPLFSELQKKLRVYTQLLNIIAMELFNSAPECCEELRHIIERFFSEEYFPKWLQFIGDLPLEPWCRPENQELMSLDDMPEWLLRLQSFKSFILILFRKQQPGIIQIPIKQLKLLSKHCLRLLVERSTYTSDLRPLIVISELYILVLLHYKHSYTETIEENRCMMKQLSEFITNISLCYVDLPMRAKEATLTVIIKCSDILSEEIIHDSQISLSFLNAIVYIICSELENLENCVRYKDRIRMSIERNGNDEHAAHDVIGKDDVDDSATLHRNLPMKALILCMNLLKTVVSIYHHESPSNWNLPFVTNKVFQRLLSCTNIILQLCDKQELSIELLDVLIIFARSNFNTEFLHCDVPEFLWLRLLPPKDLLQNEYNNVRKATVTENTWTVQKWWPIYARGIELITILLQEHPHYFLKDILQFVGIHEEYLIDSLLLCKQSLEPMAINLIRCTATFLANLVEYEKDWRLENSQSLFNLMVSCRIPYQFVWQFF